MNIISSVSVERFEKIKTTIKERNCKEHPGENVESMATDYLKDWKEPYGASMHDQKLTLNMLNSIMEAGGKLNEDFKCPLRALKKELEEALLKTRCMTCADTHTHMVREKLDVKSIL